MGKGIGNCQVCGKRNEFEFDGDMLTMEILDKQKCQDPKCNGVKLTLWQCS